MRKELPGINPEVVTERIQSVDVSGNRWQDLAELYLLPRNLSGANILDIGAGESDFCAYLRSKGARAYALDALYSSLGELDRRALENIIANINHQFPDTRRLSLTANHPKIKLGRMKDPTSRRFYQSIKTNPSWYISGSMHTLPFRDGVFDLVTSNLGIFGVSTVDPDFLRISIDEALRVTRKGGTVQIAPIAPSPGLSSEEQQNQINWLNSHVKKNTQNTIHVNGYIQKIPWGLLVIEKTA